MIGMMIPRSKQREMTRRQMTLDEVEEMWDRYRRGETVASLRQLIERLTVGPGRLSARYSACPWFAL